MKKKTLSIALALTVAMGIALTGCGKGAETKSAGKSEDTTVTTTTDEKSSETEQGSTGDTDESTETETEEDYTYCNLLSDPYFDWDNAIKDENGTAGVQSVIPSAEGKELLYNIVDGDRYVEITGAESYDVNKTIEVDAAETGLFPNLAYYGVDPNPEASGGPVNEFQCMGDTLPYWDTNYGNYGFYLSNEEITILKAYTIPDVDGAHGSLPAIAIERHANETSALCEVEYNGTHYWTTSIPLECANGQREYGKWVE